MALEWNRGTVALIPHVSPNHTITNAINAIGSFLLQSGWELASWSPGGNDRYYIRADRATATRWRYEGDGPIQHGGIHVSAETSDTEIWISSFLENQTPDDSQFDTRDAAGQDANRQGKIVIAWDVTAANNYLMIGGEDGFYIEAGRDSSAVNLGHGSIACFAEVAELNATKEPQVRWTAQGAVLDFFGACRFTTTRNNRFATNDGTNRNFTAYLSVYTPRGVYSVTSSPSPVDGPSYFIGNRDLMLAQSSFGGVSGGGLEFACTFGHLNSPEDDRYRLAPITFIQASVDMTARAVISASTSTTLPPDTSIYFRDQRHDRQLVRFVVADYSLLPFINIVEAQTGQVYRLFEFNDAGRTANLGIVWPTNVITPATS